MNSQAVRGKILVVDDTEANIDILLATLGPEYEVSVAMDGNTALQSAVELMPDLILLDIMMPEMDGYEVCRRLKADKATRDIPVIFLTAFSADSAEETGLSIGAIDYINKPFNPALVRARVRNHVELRRSQLDTIRQRDQLEAAYRRLQDLEKMRDDLVHLIVHDMRSPLASMGTYIELVRSGKPDSPGFNRDDCLRHSMESANTLSEMVTSLLDVSRLESGKMPLNRADCDIRELTESAVERLGGLVASRNVSVDLPTEPVLFHGDREVIQRVIQNLLGNALKFTSPEGCVRINVIPEHQWIRLSVADTGPGIPREYHEKVFQKFGQVEMKEQGQPSTGLGLTFCKLAVEAHGGSIQLESEPGSGTIFHVRLPVTIQAGVAQTTAKAGEEDLLQEKIEVFVVDEELSVTDSMKRYLESNTRWSVTGTNRPGHAIRVAMERKPGLILLDADMPQVSGPEISEELKHFPGLNRSVVVFFTGLIRPEETGESGIRLKGDYPIIAKGLPMAKVLDTLVTLLKRKRQG